jgi:cytochrome P450
LRTAINFIDMMSTKQPDIEKRAVCPAHGTRAVSHPESVEPARPGLDFQDPAFHADPFPALARLRITAPIHAMQLPDGRRGWLVTRFEDVTQALKNPRISTVPPAEHPTFEGAAGIVRLLQPLMIEMEPPEHARLRGLIAKAFTPRFVEGLRPRIQQIADTLIDTVLPRGEMELISDFAFPLPITVIAEMLGIPVEDQDRLRDWSAALFDSFSMRFDAESQARAEEFAAYITALIETKRREPREDLISQLVLAEEAGAKLTEQELRALIVLLIFAGHETTVNLLGNGMLALFMHPAELDKLRRDLSLVPAAVEELLRFCGPVMIPAARYATTDVEIGGTTIARGEMLMLALASADRNEAQFPAAETLDIARTSSKHLAFGHGVHYCVGAPLARMEAQVALATLLRRLPGLRLNTAPDTLQWRGNMSLRGLHALPVAF